ncbi:sterol desaturase family protein [Thiohalobacter thiocyanaticus]|uniref:Fatty acid hydroxylase n=1 Tax=Thiohalobacter thiocyanaticus TaxID=585455 RepID=A0A426QH11_9GAMM|nr:sterol desaturase family protein [Thiohalobacter thiocyanaticus]RRQ21039.1 fatty acid hydroxylase [Thiohalobacter thiocyanaticus]
MSANRTASAQSREQSIRLFDNPLLEALSHVHPIMPLLVWLPVAVWLLVRAVTVHGIGPIGLAGIGIAGLVTWTFAEYTLHRFVFHYPARSRLGKRFVFLFHGVHHDTPQDKTRLVMPPAGAALILGVLWLLFSSVLPHPWAEPFTAFFLLGYLVYDYIHYATHHFPMRHPVLRFLKQYHMHHHFSADAGRYGVSSPLWDRVFGTYLPPRGR